MNSLTSRQTEQERREAEIRRQIAELQAQLTNGGAGGGSTGEVLEAPTTPKKRKRDDQQKQQKMLAPATPSPKKRRKPEHDPKRPSFPLSSTSSSRAGLSHPSLLKKPPAPVVTKPTPSIKPGASSVLNKLASFSSGSTGDQGKNSVARSSGFAEAPARPEASGSNDVGGNRRDEDLALIEDLTMGPYEHKPPFDDPHFQKLEPNSGIRLSEREIPHEDFQDYLRGRYYLSPSKLYSVIRLLPNKQGYDVPVEGDWVTIAVVAERGPLRYSKAPVGVGKDDSVLAEKDDGVDALNLDAPAQPAKPEFQRWKGKKKEEPQKPSGKKYMNLKLIDFGCRSKSSATAGKSVIRGDAFLSLLLFEADRVEEIKGDDGRIKKIYRGGSRGAFERLSKLREGAVVALLNPKILKPFQNAANVPHPRDNILAITPESIESIAVIGHALDLGMCQVVKRDGKVCGGWCDKRVSDVCDWHIQHAVQQKRAGRAEFTTSTSGMSSTARKKAAYDPGRQWGLKPEPETGPGSTYIISGHIVSGSKEPNSLFVSENIGRDAQAKAARKLSTKDADRELEKLLKRDKEGMRAVKAARDHQKKMAKKEEAAKKGGKNAKSAKGTHKERESSESESSDSEKSDKAVKNAFSATMVRSLGFDPTAKEGRKVKDTEVVRKLDALASLQASRKKIDLGPRPGKLKSTVRAPEKPKPARPMSEEVEEDLSGRESPLRFPSDDEDGPATTPEPSTVAMVDLDSSDIE